MPKLFLLASLFFIKKPVMAKIAVFLITGIIIIFFLLLSRQSMSKVMISVNFTDEALALHYNSIVVDTHCDTLANIIDANGFPNIDLGQPTPFAVDIPKLREGGIRVQFFATWVPERFYPGQVLNRTLAMINGLYATLDKNPDSIGLATSSLELKELVAAGKIAAVLTMEGADSLKKPYGIELLHQYYDLGVRAVGFSWNDSNQLAEGYSGKYFNNKPSPNGLTPYGAEVIKELNRLGILVDVSHLPPASFWDIMELTVAPVIASHSGVNSLRNHFRNLTDDQILAIAAKGGVVQVVFHAPFLAYPGEQVTAATIADHIDYIVKLAGVDHVGLGSDFDGGLMPAAIKNAAMLPRITQELFQRGYSPLEIKKILGGNTLRLLHQVWSARDGQTNYSSNNYYQGTPGTTDSGKEAEPSMLAIVPISPAAMGQVITEANPLLSAKISPNPGLDFEISNENFQVIFDGKVYPAEYDKSTGIIAALIAEPLNQGFHVVTFKASSSNNISARQTIIFYTP